jgi:hypothetical protein
VILLAQSPKAFSIFGANNILMRTLFLSAILVSGLTSSAQYYYKDIVGTKESADLIRLYKNARVTKVVLTSFDDDNQKDDDFFVEQLFSLADNSLKTVTRSSVSNPATLVSYFDANGNVIRTVDSSDRLVSWTEYSYNSNGQLVTVTSLSSDSAKQTGMNEQHIWQWQNNVPVRMLRIKNGKDTIYVDLKSDENGLVIEEQETHKKQKSFPFFYYYNDNKQLTDIARFSPKANQVIADYMFEYSDKGQVIQKITVPANNSKYLIWRYQYNPKGLKTKEAIYDKQKKLNGKIEYQYSFGS